MSTILTTLATITEWGLTIYEWVIIIAIVLTWVSPDPRNPIVQFLNNLTVPLWRWLEGHLPASLRLFSAYVSLLLVWFLQIFLPGTLRSFARFSDGALRLGDLPGVVLGFLLLGLGMVAQSLLFFLMVILVIWFVLTLVNPSINNPIVRSLYFLVDPLISPIQRRLPRQRVDLSPLLAAGVFLLLNLLVVVPLVRLAASMTLGSDVAAPGRPF